MKSKISKIERVEMARRLSDVVTKSGYSILAFGKIVEISNLWRKVNCVSPITDYDIMKICSHFNVSKTWLLTGGGEMGDIKRLMPNKDIGEKDEDDKKEKSAESPSVIDANRVPYYDIDFTCSVKEVYSDEAEAPTGFVSIPGSASADFCCRTSGDSMAPYIMRGDVVAMKKIENWSSFIPYNEVYGIVTTNGLRTIKVVKKGSEEGQIILHSYNSEYEDQEIDVRTIVYMYRVMAIARVF